MRMLAGFPMWPVRGRDRAGRRNASRAPLRRGLAAGALLACALATAAAAAPAPRFALTSPPDTVRIDEAGHWTVQLLVANPLELGLYTDSLVLVVRDLDAGSTGNDRVTRQDLTRQAQAFSPISSGDSAAFALTLVPPCERAVLEFRWYGHNASKATFQGSAVLPAGPGEFELAHPSRLVTAGGRKVEIVEVPPSGASGPAPGLLLVHGHGGHARGMLRVAGRLSEMGYGVVLVSQPGYGLSQGPADFMGPATVAALEAALDALRRMPGVDKDRLAAWGVSRGATAALLLAERAPAGLRAVVAQSGLYDVPGWVAAGAPSTALTNAQAEAGSAADRWTVRSPLAGAARVKADVLLIHGRGDLTSPIGQARRMAEALRAGGAVVDTQFVAGDHTVPRSPTTRTTLEFLKRLSAR